jgi:cytochrome b subunit of formate dehydrogenase
MEIFGGFMVMMSIIGLFLAVVWLIMPFVVFAIKGKQDRSLEILEVIDKRLAAVEQQIKRLQSLQETHETTAAGISEAATPAPDQTPQQEVLPLA